MIWLVPLLTAAGCAVIAWGWYHIGYMDGARDQRRADDKRPS